MFRTAMVGLVLASALGAADLSGRWVGTIGPEPVDLRLRQTGSQLAGTIAIGASGKAVPIRNVALADENVALESETAMFELAWTISGPPIGDRYVSLTGHATLAGRDSKISLYPTRESENESERSGPASAPGLVYKTSPKYTGEMRAAGFGGTVVVNFEVEPNGLVDPASVRVVRGLGNGPDEYAMDCVRQWRFRPAYKGGFAVRSKLTTEVAFRLH